MSYRISNGCLLAAPDSLWPILGVLPHLVLHVGNLALGRRGADPERSLSVLHAPAAICAGPTSACVMKHMLSYNVHWFAYAP
jgi:hypothetical protein